MNDTTLAIFITQAEYDNAVRQATAAATAYYAPTDGDAAPVMADADYDTLLDQIAATETANPQWANSGGLLSDVAAGVSTAGDVKHTTPMLSLGKISFDPKNPDKTATEIRGFAATINSDLVGEPKLDGLAVNATYRNGDLIRVALRGDGTAGEDVTAQARDIAGMPTRLASNWTGEVRGEVYMSDDDFAAASAARNAAGKGAFVNPRNAVAGSIRKVGRTYDAPMSFGSYDIVGEGIADDMTHLDAMTYADSLGFATAVNLLPAGIQALHKNADTLLDAIDGLEQARASLGYTIDGFVIKANTPADRANLGATSRTPRWATAYKYAPEATTTVLLDIVRNVGQTGVVSLTAVLAPKFVGGVTVTSATLHNQTWITEHDLHVGDTVMVMRRGDVIPRIEAPLVALRPADAVPSLAPTTCPKCDEELDTTSSLLWRCTNPDCSTGAKIAYAVHRGALDVDGLSTGTVDALVEAGLVKNVADLFDLTVEQVANVKMGTTDSGASRLLGTANATRIVNGLEAAKAQPFNRVLTSLAIRKLGKTFGRRLAAHYGSMSALQAATLDDLINSGIDGVKDGRAAYFHAGLTANADVIVRLAAAGLQMDTGKAAGEQNPADLPFSGMTIVVSGSVPGMTRDQSAENIERLGGKSSGSVSKSTSLLVTSETTTSKAVKATSLGVKIMDPAEFAAIVAAAS